MPNSRVVVVDDSMIDGRAPVYVPKLRSDADGLLALDESGKSAPISYGDKSMSVVIPVDVSSSFDSQHLLSETDDEKSQLSAVRARIAELERESIRLQQMQTAIERLTEISNTPTSRPIASLQTMTQSVSELARRECDERSVYVGNVEYAATAAELEEHFAKGMVDVNRVTIMINKYTQQPKGFAYMELSNVQSYANALALDESIFMGRQLKVLPKRTNVPGLTRHAHSGGGFGDRRGGAPRFEPY